MYKRKSIKKLGKKTSHRKALIKNQLRSLMLNGKIRTSSVKAKVIKGEISSIFGKAKKEEGDNITLLRNLIETFGNMNLAKKVIDLAKKSTTKVTIKKIGFRAGDNTEISEIEISGFKSKVKSKKDLKKEEKEEEVVETKVSEEKKRGILNLGKKNISKVATPLKKERARSRSGL